jgi:hypothetical protein
MYLVSPECTNANKTELPPLVSKEAKMPPVPMKRSNKKSKRSVKKKNATKRSIDKWAKLRARLQEADLERKREIKTVADFLKKVLPSLNCRQPKLFDSLFPQPHCHMRRPK